MEDLFSDTGIVLHRNSCMVFIALFYQPAGGIQVEAGLQA
jgi:hypothetical protein